jgi:hypothetical protein
MLTNARVFRKFLSGSLFILTTLYGCIAPSVVLAQAVPPDDPIALYRQTGIDSGQEDRIRALADAYEKSEDEKAHKLIGFLNRLKSLSMVPDLDEKDVLETQASINKLQSEMALDKMHLLINIRRVLNRNQRIKLVSLIQNRNKTGVEGTAP